MKHHPLIRPGRLDAVIALRQGRPITAARFLGEAAALAGLLPRSNHVVNLCGDRYHFAVGLAAALMRGQVSLLPPNDTPEMLAQLARDYPDLYLLGDRLSGQFPFPTLNFPDELAGDEEATIPAFPADQIAALLFTSGSTGRPTPHPRSWGSLVRGATAVGRQFGVDALPGALVVGTVPHQHSYGLESTVLLPLQHGLILHAERPFFPSDICASLAASPYPRILVTTPIHLRTLLADLGDLPPVDLVVSATAPLSSRIATEAEKRFAAPLYEIYGCSEAGQIAVRRTTETAEWRCLEGVSLRQEGQETYALGDMIDAETRLNDEIELRGPDRFLLHGRLADLVNIAGKRTSLAYLNYQLNAIEGVSDGLFVMPEGEGDGVARLTAFVVAPSLSADAILSALRLKIDAVFLPRPLHFVDILPRNSVGKITRDTVVELTRRAAGR